jgi:hypothetical protein
MERVASVNLPQYLSTALSVMTGLIWDIANNNNNIYNNNNKNKDLNNAEQRRGYN